MGHGMKHAPKKPIQNVAKHAQAASRPGKAGKQARAVPTYGKNRNVY